MKYIKCIKLTLLLAVILPACTQQTPQQSTRPLSTEIPTAPPVIKHPAPTVQKLPQKNSYYYGDFDTWKRDFAHRLIAQGFSQVEVERLLSQAQLNQRVISLDTAQPEFAKMPWEYVDGAASSLRIRQGQQQFTQQNALLMRLEQQYGVPASIILAIWGMESSYGQGTGSTDLVSSLATLAYEGRRRDFAEAQLRAMLQLLQRGDVVMGQLKGSWAGGMGHTQFIPDTWLKQGVDGNGDGRRNPWVVADALSSTANYLHHAGWVRGLSPFYEVRLPAGFNYALSGTKKTFQEWQSLGVSFLTTSPAQVSATAELWLPAGAQGPALLLSPNFDVIKVYNNSSNYALGISLLAKGIVNLPMIQTPWPRSERALSTSQARQLQQRLTALGFDTHGADGVIGSNTRKAFQRWQLANGQLADGFISQRTAARLIY